MVKDREIVIQGHLAAEVEKYLTMTVRDTEPPPALSIAERSEA
jgi:hypothetical protein